MNTEYVQNPNLPERKVKTVLADFRIPHSITDKLSRQGIGIIKTMKISSVYNAVCGHPDIQLHHLYSNVFVCAAEAYRHYKEILTDCELIQGTSILASNYPSDIAYNVARIDKLAFHNVKYTDKTILEYFEKANIKLIDVKQGYSKCNVCITAKNAIITSDIGIAKAADNYNVDVLFISQGHIRLSDFPYGFIGGASGLTSHDTLTFTGNVEMHPDYERIAVFAEKYNVKLVSLGNHCLTDIGSLIPIFV